jgi:hypothetical protein
LIEIQMVRRMAVRGVIFGIPLVIAMWIIDGPLWAFSAAVGVAMTIGNLWFAALLIGKVADSSPNLLLPVAMVAFVGGLMLLTGIALGLRALDLIYFPVTGFSLIGIHLGVVIWEAIPGRSQAVSNTRVGQGA